MCYLSVVLATQAVGKAVEVNWFQECCFDSCGTRRLLHQLLCFLFSISEMFDLSLLVFFSESTDGAKKHLSLCAIVLLMIQQMDCILEQIVQLESQEI